MTVLTISIPAYNDAPSIAAVTRDAVSAAAACTPDYEILLINDGSQDNTQEVIDELCRTTPRLRALRHPRNLGFGPTIRECYLEARSDWVVFLPGDGQIPPAAVQTLFPHTRDYDLVLAYRRDRRDPINRRFTSWCYNRLVSLVAGRRIHDVNGTALVRRTLLDSVSLTAESAFVHAEIALKAMAAGARFREVEIEHRPREHGSGSGNKLGVIASTFRDLAGYTVNRVFARERAAPVPDPPPSSR